MQQGGIAVTAGVCVQVDGSRCEKNFAHLWFTREKAAEQRDPEIDAFRFEQVMMMLLPETIVQAHIG